MHCPHTLFSTFLKLNIPKAGRFVSSAPVCVGLFLLFPATLGLACVLPFCAVSLGRAHGPAFRREYLLGFAAIVRAHTRIPTIVSPCNTKRGADFLNLGFMHLMQVRPRTRLLPAWARGHRP